VREYGKMRVGLLDGQPEGKRPLERPKLRSENIRLGLTAWNGRAWTGLIWLRIGTSTVDNEPSGCMKCDDFFDQLSNC